MPSTSNKIDQNDHVFLLQLSLQNKGWDENWPHLNNNLQMYANLNSLGQYFWTLSRVWHILNYACLKMRIDRSWQQITSQKQMISVDNTVNQESS